MRQFACKVRLGGSLYNEVPKGEVTAAEIIVLRAIHGKEGVIDIKEVEPVKRTSEEERARLISSYGSAIAKRQEIVGGMGALIGLGGPVPDSTDGLPTPAARKAKGEKVEETKTEEPVLEDAEA